MVAQKGKDLLLKVNADGNGFVSMGLRRSSISGSGIFKDAQSDELVKSTFFGASIVPWQIIIPEFGTVEGGFQIVSLEYAGQHDGEVTFNIALESAGEINFQGGS